MFLSGTMTCYITSYHFHLNSSDYKETVAMSHDSGQAFFIRDDEHTFLCIILIECLWYNDANGFAPIMEGGIKKLVRTISNISIVRNPSLESS